MNSTIPEDKWQVEVGGQIYEANYGELTEWINEGSLLPLDKVRRGNLRWIEARKVPGLRAFFDAKEQGIEPPVFAATSKTKFDKSNPLAAIENSSATVKEQALPGEIANVPNKFDSNAFEPISSNLIEPENASLYVSKFDQSLNEICPPSNAVCNLHTDAEAEYFCETCGNSFCKVCPKSFGSSVKICPFCGAMCKSIKQLCEKDKSVRRFENAANESFGAADLIKALTHPFKYKSSLFFGALMFAFFTVGQTASAIGGFVMLGAALFCALGANMLTFGILANTIEKFSSGNLDADFMPDFDDFSIWDDVVHPFFLSIGAYLVSFGPFILVCIVGVYLIFSSMTMQAIAMQNEIAKVPGTPAFDRSKTIEQSEAVKNLTENLRVQNEKNLVRHAEMQSENFETEGSRDEEKEFREIEQIIQESRKSQLESIAGKTPEAERREFEQMIRGFLGLAAPLVVIGFLAFLWGMFYFPAACSVAGYTRSFAATIDPRVGLDTIRRLGFDYVKILLIGFLIIVAASFAGVSLSIIFAPFEMPRMGNLPAKAFGSVFTFYFSIVFSSVLGYALYKNAARLRLPRG
jgi:hypothetical protein